MKKPEIRQPKAKAEPPKEPYLDGTVLHHRGEEYDLKEFDAQQFFHEPSGQLYYQLLSHSNPTYLKVESVSEAHELEAVCNKHFRGW